MDHAPDPDLIGRVEHLAELANRTWEAVASRERAIGGDPEAAPSASEPIGPRQRARELLDHTRDYLLPRARDLDAPLVVALLGPTGSGKSTIVNSLAGALVSEPGVLAADHPGSGRRGHNRGRQVPAGSGRSPRITAQGAPPCRGHRRPERPRAGRCTGHGLGGAGQPGARRRHPRAGRPVPVRDDRHALRGPGAVGRAGPHRPARVAAHRGRQPDAWGRGIRGGHRGCRPDAVGGRHHHRRDRGRRRGATRCDGLGARSDGHRSPPGTGGGARGYGAGATVHRRTGARRGRRWHRPAGHRRGRRSRACRGGRRAAADDRGDRPCPGADAAAGAAHEGHGPARRGDPGSGTRSWARTR